jgi:hypothetical protein
VQHRVAPAATAAARALEEIARFVKIAAAGDDGVGEAGCRGLQASREMKPKTGVKIAPFIRGCWAWTAAPERSRRIADQVSEAKNGCNSF